MRALKSLRATGNVTGVTISIGGRAGNFGDVGSVSVGSFVNSELFAGYAGPADGSALQSCRAQSGHLP